MPFEAYLTAGFQHGHENDMFGQLVDRLQARFGQEPAPHILIGNLLVEGNDLDAFFLKPGSISVIEMKAHGGRLSFSENFPWQITHNGNSSIVKGGSKENPYIQARLYRRGLRDFLVNHQREILRKSRLIVWDHVSAVVLFGGKLEFDARVLGGLRLWFDIMDFGAIADHLARKNDPLLKLEAEELRAIPQIIGLTRDHLYNPTDVASKSPLQIAQPPALKRQFLYVKEFAIRDQEERMSCFGGARSQGAQKLKSLLAQVRQGVNPFAVMSSKTDTRIDGAHIYTVNTVTELVLIEKDAGV